MDVRDERFMHLRKRLRDDWQAAVRTELGSQDAAFAWSRVARLAEDIRRMAWEAM